MLQLECIVQRGRWVLSVQTLVYEHTQLVLYSLLHWSRIAAELCLSVCLSVSSSYSIMPKRKDQRLETHVYSESDQGHPKMIKGSHFFQNFPKVFPTLTLTRGLERGRESASSIRPADFLTCDHVSPTLGWRVFMGG